MEKTDFKNQKKAKNPKFTRQDSYKKKRLSTSWRKPRGWDSKQRKRMQGQPVVDPGYGSPAELRGHAKNGLDIVNVDSLEQVKNLNPKHHSPIVSGKLGLKKKMAILAELIKHKFTIQNLKKPEEYLEGKKALLESRKEKKVDKVEKPAAQKKGEKEEAKESIDDKLSDEEKKKIEKKEIDKLLTKKF